MFAFDTIFRAGYADGCDGISMIVKNRGSETDQSDDIFFIVYGVSLFLFPAEKF